MHTTDTKYPSDIKKYPSDIKKYPSDNQFFFHNWRFSLLLSTHMYNTPYTTPTFITEEFFY